ncbi:MAG: FAD-binding oxidoreductase [Proteobacteria bacterium]|nr:FAD-binding oxidoreductase [Pseudomonadota bacterium]
MTDASAALLREVATQLPAGALLTPEEAGARHRADWTRVNPCAPAAVARPRATDEVAAILRACHAAGQPVVVQGGLTGLAGGATPRAGELALSLERLAGVEWIDADAGAMQVCAGTPLAVAQAAAEAHGLQLALDLGSRGSCTVGGNIATNAGGNRVIRYGMMRELVLGLEAVLADGTVLTSLSPMLKNNAGYDLKQLFIGTEGTLGVVTRAVLRLHAAPRERLTAFVAAPSFAALVALLRAARGEFGGELGSFEAMWSNYYELALAALPVGPRPFDGRHPFYVLLEIEALEPVAVTTRLESFLARQLEAGTAAEALITRSLEEGARLWRVRESAGEIMMTLGIPMGYDVSLPIARMPAFLERLDAEVPAVLGEQPLYVFGHLGDGNLHLVTGLRSPGQIPALDQIVYGALAGYGSVSAEHGIGQLKRHWLPASRSPAELATMRLLKSALDPRNILNPGRVL